MPASAAERKGDGKVSLTRPAVLGLATATLTAALYWPLPDWAVTSMTAHMVQTLFLLDVGPGLLLVRFPPRRVPWPTGAAALLYGAALWGWHMPVSFQAAILLPGVRVIALATFLLAGLAFWASLAGPGREARAIVWAFVTMLHTGLLGALITFAPPTAYAALCSVNALLTPAEDQQLAGLLMWVPGGGLYLLVALVLVARWLSPERTAPHGEVQVPSGAPTSSEP